MSEDRTTKSRAPLGKSRAPLREGRAPLGKSRAPHDEPAPLARLEHVIGTVLRGGVLISTVCLSVGLLLSLATTNDAASGFLLNAGIIVLLSTPVARVIVSTVQYVIERDWAFATLTVIVLVELMASAVAALVFNRRT